MPNALLVVFLEYFQLRKIIPDGIPELVRIKIERKIILREEYSKNKIYGSEPFGRTFTWMYPGPLRWVQRGNLGAVGEPEIWDGFDAFCRAFGENPDPEWFSTVQNDSETLIMSFAINLG